jgi:hypothetical protein
MHLWGFQDGLAVRLEIVLDVPAVRRQLFIPVDDNYFSL